MIDNQYAIVPLSVINDLVLKYKIADPNTWIVQKLNADLETYTVYGGLEENTFSLGQRIEISSLGGIVFNSKQHYFNFINEYEQQRNFIPSA